MNTTRGAVNGQASRQQAFLLELIYGKTEPQQSKMTSQNRAMLYLEDLIDDPIYFVLEDSRPDQH